MGKMIRTARGEQLDFDLLKIKKEIATAPQSLHVRKRKDFIEQRLRRRVKRSLEAKDEPVKAEETADGSPEKTSEKTPENKEVVEAPTKTKATKTTRQRARKKTTTSEGEKDESTSKSDI